MEEINKTINEMVKFVPNTIFIMFCSITITYIMIKKGLFIYINKIIKPINNILKLPEQITLSSIVAFGSALSANIMLVEFYKMKMITERETYLGAILNSTSVTIKEIFTYQFPIIMPLLGLKSGIIYFFCFVSSIFIKWVYIYLYLKCDKKVINQRESGTKDSKTFINKQQPKINISYKQQIKLFLKNCSIYIFITFIILYIMNMEITKYFEGLIEPITKILKLPSILIVPIITFIFSPVAGATSISLLLKKECINYIDAVLAIILGSFLLLPFFSLRSGLAKSISIFGVRLGIKILSTSTILTMISRLIFIVIIIIYKGGLNL